MRRSAGARASRCGTTSKRGSSACAHAKPGLLPDIFLQAFQGTFRMMMKFYLTRSSVLMVWFQLLCEAPQLLTLDLKHYHMSSAQFRCRTSELHLLKGVYRLYDSVVKDCEVCLHHRISRFAGVRAKEFGDVVCMVFGTQRRRKERSQSQRFHSVNGSTSTHASPSGMRQIWRSLLHSSTLMV